MDRAHQLLNHIPHPHIEARKEFLKWREAPQSFNRWLAVKITNGVGTMWCAYAFGILALISLPAAIQGGISPMVSWVAQTFLQLVLLSIIIVGQNIASEKSNQQLEQTYKDAEALLQMNDEMHQLILQNVTLSGQISELLKQNMTLTEQINALVCKGKQG